jgi:hypothetical protein
VCNGYKFVFANFVILGFTGLNPRALREQFPACAGTEKDREDASSFLQISCLRFFRDRLRLCPIFRRQTPPFVCSRQEHLSTLLAKENRELGSDRAAPRWAGLAGEAPTARWAEEYD